MRAYKEGIYVPLLDGLRATSIALVVVGHFGFHAVPGLLGVTIFFFISGYLITQQLFNKIDETGSIDIPRFYLLRALRLYPPLLVMVVASLAWFLLAGVTIPGIETVAALLYFSNYWAFVPVMSGVTHPFGVLWSLAVEEHYYLVFPFLMVFLSTNRIRFAVILLTLIGAVTVWRTHVSLVCEVNACIPLRVEHGTDTRVDSILWGALLAVLLNSGAKRRVKALLSSRLAFPAGAIMLVLSLCIRDTLFRDTVRFTVQSAALFLCIGGLLVDAHLDWLDKLLSLRPSVLLGRLSYSLYLWHWLVLVAAESILPTSWTAPLHGEAAIPPAYWIAEIFIPMVMVSLILSYSSWRLIEAPMVAVRRRFGASVAAERGMSAMRHNGPRTKAAGTEAALP